jgi:dTDP-4-amino-4,6-dideoxygalactose transaminase
VDCEARTGNLDLDQVESLITPRTRAITLVHYLGLPVDMPRVMEIARKHSLYVVEDCALALGGRIGGMHSGLFGDCGCFSFYPVKHITTAEGGMILCQDPELAQALARKKAFGVDRHHGERKVPGEYDVDLLGMNYRLNELQAALGIRQLRRLPDFLSRRRENHRLLAAALAEMEEVELLESGSGETESGHYCLSAILAPGLRDRRFEVVQRLKEAGVGTSVYYPRPVPHLSYYRQKYGHGPESFPQAARISYGSIALPVGPHLDGDDMAYIAQALKQAVR